MRGAITLVCGLILLMACSSSKKKAYPPYCANDNQCTQCATDLRDWLQAIREEGPQSSLFDQRGLEMVVTDPATATSPLPVSAIILVREDAVTYDGRHVGDPRAIMDSPTEHWELLELRRLLTESWKYRCQEELRTSEQSIIVQVDEKVPWRVVSDVVTTVEASGIEKIYFAVNKESEIIKFTTPRLRERIAQYLRLEGSKAPIEVFANCDAARTAFKLFVAGERDSQASKAFEHSISKAIEECGCRIDFDSFKAWHLLGRWSYQLPDDGEIDALYHTALPLTLVDGSKPLGIENAGDTPWSVAYKSLAAQRKGSSYLLVTGADLVERSVRPGGHACEIYEKHKDTVVGNAPIPFTNLNKTAGPDDRAVYGGLLGDDLGEMAGGWGYGISGVGPGEGGTGWGTIGPVDDGTVRRGSASEGNTSTDDKAKIRKVIRSKLPDIRHCYEKSLLVNPNAAGTLTVMFQIAPDGTVKGINAHGLEKVPEVGTCVATLIRSLKFAEPEGGGYFNVRYPFTFKPTD